MKKNKPSKKKVKPSPLLKQTSENSESIINEILKFHNLVMRDTNSFGSSIMGLRPRLPYESALVFTIYVGFLVSYLTLVPDILLVFLRDFKKSQEQAKQLLKELKALRLDIWFLKTIFENTPNLPWDKFGKYVSSQKLFSIDIHSQEQKDLAKFYFSDKLRVLPTDELKSMFWGRFEQYLQKNVFEKLEMGETPREIKTIRESILRETKQDRIKEKLGSTVLQGIDPESEEFTYLDFMILKAFSEDNPHEQLVERLDNQKKIRKLREAYNLFTDRQKQVIRLRFFDDLTLEEASKELGIDLSTTYEHEKAAKEKIKKTLCS